jgi:hypothetical protein
MRTDILNPRRVPRVPLRCAVEIRHRFSSWSGQLEDLGPGGCQIVSPRAVEPGRELKLVIRCDALARPLGATGKVVWSRAEAPARIGVAFKVDDPEQAAWFEALVAADPVAGRAARSVPDRLPRQTRVHLGKPPQLLVDFSPVEKDLLRRVGAGVTLDALARSFGPELDERIAGALFSLVQRRFLVFDPVSSVGVARWRGVLADEGAPPPPPTEADRARDARRPVQAQRLYDEALVHIGAGRLGFAVDRLREALALAPGDESIAATLARIERWA